jgi:hypothetical protein
MRSPVIAITFLSQLFICVHFSYPDLSITYNDQESGARYSSVQHTQNTSFLPSRVRGEKEPEEGHTLWSTFIAVFFISLLF